MTAAASSKTRMKSASRGKPCQVCEGINGCSVGEDGLMFCRKREGDQPGFVYLGKAERDPQWSMYRREDDPVVIEREREFKAKQKQSQKSPQPSAKKAAQDSASGCAVDFGALAEQYRGGLTPALSAELAAILGLPEACLSSLPIGYKLDEDCWTFPECNAAGRIVGITRRFRNGDKRQVANSARGIIIPKGWQERGGPIFLPEGASGTLAMTAMGLWAVGRCNNTGGAEILSDFLRNVLQDKPVVVVGDWDPKDNGQWLGRDGADEVAKKLANGLGRTICRTVSPDKAKDTRDWVTAKNPDPTIADMWHDLGNELEKKLLEHVVEFQPQGNSGDGVKVERLATTCLAGIQPQPLRWLVPGYLPLGKLVLGAGDGGHGKSTMTLRLAADLSRGRPALGLDYADAVRGETLLISCEDDSGGKIFKNTTGNAPRQVPTALLGYEDARPRNGAVVGRGSKSNVSFLEFLGDPGHCSGSTGTFLLPL
jgi:AAA domain